MRHVLACLVLAPLALAQTPTHVSPKNAATQFGNINNTIPFQFTGVYQQVHEWTSFNVLTSTTLIRRLRFRKVNGATTYTGGNVDIEIFMGLSPNSALTCSSTFASNVTPSSERNVVLRKQVKLPDISDSSWSAADFAFDTPFIWTLNNNLTWRTVIHSNTTTSYVLDAWSDWRNGIRSTYTGCRHPQSTQNPSHNSTYRSPGNIADFNGYTWFPAVTPGILALGASNTQWGPLKLPFSLAPLGAPGCAILNDWLLALTGVSQNIASGFLGLKVPFPNNPALVNAIYYSQYIFIDSKANALGAFVTNGLTNGPIPAPNGVTRIYATGNATATQGTLGPEFCVAIALN